ncbi:hypothetical protein QBC33DRAFT_198567 [Phialemonium atrogriseum]|uniref:Uncharacterized protein n=1 Tax=Phialemonium atrogriseum TaxID=1093897 RepID=A0AAJ0FDB7_9PEZI|nr:uncharacterized protein QBC33DRAFT_198567 [Phialemonium atrogriseum]KAK1764426.1 hypothetical protein QBC33DRAFT_198567 [Phialemonium atrogriseum]
MYHRLPTLLFCRCLAPSLQLSNWRVARGGWESPHGDSLFASHLLPGISQAASGSLSLKPFVIPCCYSPPTSHITVTFVSLMMSWLAWVSNHLLRRFEKQIVIPHASITPHTPPSPEEGGWFACTSAATNGPQGTAKPDGGHYLYTRFGFGGVATVPSSSLRMMGFRSCFILRLVIRWLQANRDTHATEHGVVLRNRQGMTSKLPSCTSNGCCSWPHIPEAKSNYSQAACTSLVPCIF